jgi:hypothetical protein
VAETILPDSEALTWLFAAVEKLSDEQDADVYMYSGDIDRSSVQRFLATYEGARHRANCVLVLVTFGGDPDAAYVMARFLKRAYQRLTVLVFGPCKSAGTLAVLGATEIVMGPFGELGPLDIQLSKEDSLASRSSGLDIFQSLSILSRQAFTIFQQHFLGIVGGSGGVITTRTAADISTAIATQLLQPIAAQIEPMRLGEMQRAINVAIQYGTRLGTSEEVVNRLTMDYPAHGFVIDLEEAEKLFPGQVRVPGMLELELERGLRAAFRVEDNDDVLQYPPEHTVTWCLTPRDGVFQDHLMGRLTDELAFQASAPGCGAAQA